VYASTLSYNTNLATAAGGSGAPAGAGGTVFFGIPPAPLAQPGSSPVIVDASREAGHKIVIIWAAGLSGSTNVVEYSPTLTPWQGTTLQDNVIGEGWTSPASLPGEKGFFRIREKR
jgi:hypothetical protein